MAELTALRPPVVEPGRPEIVDRVDAAGVADMTEVARLAAAHYGIPPDCRLHLYPLTENWTFRIEADGAVRGVLRIYRPDNRSPAEIHSELAWMEALRQESPTAAARGHPDPAGRPGPRGRARAAAGPLLLRAVRPRAGERARRGPARGLVPAAGRDHRPAAQARPGLGGPALVPAPALGSGHHAGRPAALGVLAVQRSPTPRRRRPDPAAGRRRDRAAAGVRHGPGRFGLVHADLRLANLLVDGERITVIDFEDCGLSWYLYDLACALTFNEGRADVRELIALWVDGYRQVETLSADDEAEIDTFLMLRRLMLSAYAGLRPSTELAAQMKADGYSAETCRIAEPYLSRFG